MNKPFFTLAAVILAACGGPNRTVDTDAARSVDTPALTRQAPPAEEAPIQELQAEPAPAPAEVEPEPDALVAAPHAPPSLQHYQLRRGETPAHFARWSGLTLETIAEASGLELTGTYPVGTEIAVPIDADGAAGVETARQAHHARRAEGWLASRGVPVQNGFHTVRTGESAWTIATEQLQIPVWLLEAYNPSVDLDRLRPGQELMVPLLADTVVDADEAR